MKLDEAITKFKNNAKYERTHGNLQGCLEFRQLAEWLEELQLEIEEKEQYYQDRFLEGKNAVYDAAMGGRMFGCGECKEIIQQKNQ